MSRRLNCRRVVHTLAASALAVFAAGCALPPEAPRDAARPAMLLPGVVPAEYLPFFARELENAGFRLVDTRGHYAPVVRIVTSRIETTPGRCTVQGTVFVGDSAVEVNRSYGWPSGSYGGTDRARAAALPPASERWIMETCLASFARTLELALRTPASPT